MDWDFSIERNREPLLRHVLGLFALIGLVEGGMVDRLSRPVYRRALTVLRSAESAVRRLIIVMARDIKVEPRPKRVMPKGLVRSRKGRFQGKGNGQGNGQANAKAKNPAGPPSTCSTRKGAPMPARSAAAGGARVPSPAYVSSITIRGFRGSSGVNPRLRPAPAPQQVETVKDYTVSAKRLCRRLFAILGALTNMEREAERYARWRDQPKEERRPRRERALRFGWPPGWRIKSTHEVDDILKECHWLVHELPEPDTS